ncbi:MAG: hypothetical protein WDO73_12235 [Ignavibacteriota bacterium]
MPGLPEDASYFHAQYRQAAPCAAITGDAAKINLDGRNNSFLWKLAAAAI